MKLYFRLVVLLLLVTNGFVSAQNAEYKKKFSEGSFLLLEENYPMALKCFSDAYKIDSSGANINYRLGLCYFHSASQKRKAEYYFAKAVFKVSLAYDDIEPSETSAPPEAYYYLGKSQQLNYKFEEAIDNYEKYKTFISAKKIERIKEVNHLIEIANNAKEFTTSPTKVVITNLGDTVNGSYPDYSPVISADESILIFTSRREGSTGEFRTVSNEFFEDIYISQKKADGTWSSPKSIDPNINTNGNEATINLTADGQQLLIYRDDNGDGNIYISNLEGDRWSVPTKLGSDINTKYWEPHACISADGNTLYFVSDRPGGFGGRDIYKCVKLPNGQWSLARNLGPTINTEYDEDAVFIHPDQVTLFFSSQGHKTMGGFDIFFTSMSDDGKWSDPTNVGAPINTTDDDIFYVVSTDGKRAYYSSIKEGGNGEKDIYLISLEESAKTQPVALLVGRIIVPEGEILPSSNEIIVLNQETGQSGIYKANTKTGKYILSLTPGKTYDISYRAEDKEFYKETFTVPLGTDYQEIEREVPLKPVVLDGKYLPKATVAKATVAEEEKKENESNKNKETNPQKEVLASNHNSSEKEKGTEEKTNSSAVDTKVVNGGTITTYTKKTTEEKAKEEAKESTVETKKVGGFVETKYTKRNNNNEADKVIEETTTTSKTVNVKDTMEGFTSTTTVLQKTNKYHTKNQPANNAINNNNYPLVKTKAPAENCDDLSPSLQLAYEIYFNYNVYQIDVKNERFVKLINSIVSSIGENKDTISVFIESSASKVPTKKFGSNEALATKRCEDAKAKLLSALKEKGIDSGRINTVETLSICGPAYSGKALADKKVYEKYQYVKIRLRK